MGLNPISHCVVTCLCLAFSCLSSLFTFAKKPYNTWAVWFFKMLCNSKHKDSMFYVFSCESCPQVRKINSYCSHWTNSLPILNTHKLFEVVNGACVWQLPENNGFNSLRESKTMNSQSGTRTPIITNTRVSGWLQRNQEQEGEGGCKLMPVK